MKLLWCPTGSLASKVRSEKETPKCKLTFCLGAHADSWSRSKRPRTEANKCWKQAEKSALEFRACKAIKTKIVKIQEKGHTEKSKEVTLTGLPKRHLLNSQVVRAMRLKIIAERPKNSERNFWQSHSAGQIKNEIWKAIYLSPSSESYYPHWNQETSLYIEA